MGITDEKHFFFEILMKKINNNEIVSEELIRLSSDNKLNYSEEKIDFYKLCIKFSEILLNARQFNKALNDKYILYQYIDIKNALFKLDEYSKSCNTINKENILNAVKEMYVYSLPKDFTIKYADSDYESFPGFMIKQDEYNTKTIPEQLWEEMKSLSESDPENFKHF